MALSLIPAATVLSELRQHLNLATRPCNARGADPVMLRHVEAARGLADLLAQSETEEAA